MTTIPPAFADFGQTLAFTERTMTHVLREHLASQGVEPETWYALKLIATGGPDAPRAAIASDLAGSPGLDDALTGALLAQLDCDGLITGEDTLKLTAAGAAKFSALREHVLGATVSLLSQFDLDDIETTVRTLRTITELAVSQSG